MVCPQCQYVMTDFDKECPRCQQSPASHPPRAEQRPATVKYDVPILTPQVSIAPRFSEDAFGVKVSANIVNWPCACCCCGDELPAPIGAKRFENLLPYVRVEASSFRATYCGMCAHHVALAQAIPRGKPADSSVANGCCAAPLVAVVVFGALNAIGGSPGMALLGALVIYAFAFWRLSQFESTKKGDFETNKGDAIIAAREATGPQCCYPADSAWVENVSGSLRRFVFRSEQFTTVFAHLNQDKIIH